MTKLKNRFLAFYARMWLADNLRYAEFFRLRVQKDGGNE